MSKGTAFNLASMFFLMFLASKNLNHAAVHQEALHCHSRMSCCVRHFSHLPFSQIIWVKCS